MQQRNSYQEKSHGIAFKNFLIYDIFQLAENQDLKNHIVFIFLYKQWALKAANDNVSILFNISPQKIIADNDFCDYCCNKLDVICGKTGNLNACVKFFPIQIFQLNIIQKVIFVTIFSSMNTRFQAMISYMSKKSNFLFPLEQALNFAGEVDCQNMKLTINHLFPSI